MPSSSTTINSCSICQTTSELNNVSYFVVFYYVGWNGGQDRCKFLVSNWLGNCMRIWDLSKAKGNLEDKEGGYALKDEVVEKETKKTNEEDSCCREMKCWFNFDVEGYRSSLVAHLTKKLYKTWLLIH